MLIKKRNQLLFFFLRTTSHPEISTGNESPFGKIRPALGQQAGVFGHSVAAWRRYFVTLALAFRFFHFELALLLFPRLSYLLARASFRFALRQFFSDIFGCLASPKKQ